MRRRSAEVREGAGRPDDGYDDDARLIEHETVAAEDEIAVKRLAVLDRNGIAESGAGNAGLSTSGSKWVDDGAYELDFSCLVAGKYWLTVSAWKESLEGAAAVAERLPAPFQFERAAVARRRRGVHARRRAQAARMMTLVAGQELAFQVHLADRFGNACGLQGPDDVAMHLDTPEGGARSTAGAARGRHDRSSTWPSAPSPGRTSRTRSSTASVVGALARRVRHRARVRRAGDVAEGCRPPTRWATRTSRRLLHLATRAYGNPLAPDYPSAAVAARVDGPSKADCMTRVLADGTVEVTMVAHLSGPYRLNVTLGGQRIPDSS